MREIRRGVDRATTRADGVVTHHSFSYGAHYDPDNIGWGPLMAINTEILDPGAGYEAHHHQDVEIVTWVLEGELRHEDSSGHHGLIRPGTAQRLSAGTGVEHTEANASSERRLVFVQMMLASDHEAEPDYASADLVAEPGRLVPAVDVRSPAELFVLRLERGHRVAVPAAPRSLVHVTAGSVQLDDATLTGGDEARLADQGEYHLSAAEDGGDVLIWQLQR